MPYIGKQPTVGNFQVCDAISVVNGQAAYTMQVGGSNVEPENANHMLVSLNGILQKPGSSFTISGSTITFASNLATGDVIDFITLLGDTLNTGAPSDDTVTAAKLNNDIISGQTALTAEPDDTDEFLVSDAGTIKRIDYSLIKGGGITMADQWRFTANTDNDSSNLGFDITSNLEQVDTAPQGTLGSAMTQSSGVFTFPATGFYFVKFNIQWQMNGDGDVRQGGGEMNWTTNNSSYSTIVDAYNGCNNHGLNYYVGAEMNTIVDITDTSNQKVKFRAYNSASNATCMGSSSANHTYFTFIRLGDT